MRARQLTARTCASRLPTERRRPIGGKWNDRRRTIEAGMLASACAGCFMGRKSLDAELVAQQQQQRQKEEREDAANAASPEASCRVRADCRRFLMGDRCAGI